jgi:hypothetical protein
LQNHKRKQTWNIVKHVTGKMSWNKPFQSVYTSINGVLTENHQLRADSFQNYFRSTADKITFNITNNEDIEDNNCIDYLYRVFNNPFPNITFDRTTTREIEKIMKSLKCKNSSGYDGISVKILKLCSSFIAAPLNYIFNRSILSGSFPTRLKYSIIKPLLKKGDNKDVKNYRPISLLTSFSKIFEKLIYTV